MTMTEKPERPRWTRRREVATVVLLSITAVVTAWCGFQASKWGGEMSISFSQASSARIQAADAASGARDARQWDVTIWVQWVLADSRDDATLRSYVQERFSPELRTAFEEWDGTGRTADGPFATDAYVPAGSDRAATLSAKADRQFDRALADNQQSDDYSLLTVLFALVLFFAAVSDRGSREWARIALFVAAVIGLVGGACLLATFPVLV